MARHPLQQLLAEREMLLHILRQVPGGSRPKMEARVARLDAQIEEARTLARAGHPKSKR